MGPNSGSASFRISSAAGSVFAGGKRASNEGLSLLRIRPAQPTHPTRHKAGTRIIYLSTIKYVPEPGFIDATEPRRCSIRRNSSVLAREPRCKRSPDRPWADAARHQRAPATTVLHGVGLVELRAMIADRRLADP